MTCIQIEHKINAFFLSIIQQKIIKAGISGLCDYDLQTASIKDFAYC